MKVTLGIYEQFVVYYSEALHPLCWNARNVLQWFTTDWLWPPTDSVSLVYHGQFWLTLCVEMRRRSLIAKKDSTDPFQVVFHSISLCCRVVQYYRLKHLLSLRLDLVWFQPLSGDCKNIKNDIVDRKEQRGQKTFFARSLIFWPFLRHSVFSSFRSQRWYFTA